MKVTQHFTGHGIIGVIFFIVGGPLSSFIALDMARSSPGAYGLGGSVIALIVGLATLASVPLMLIGREYTATGSLPPSK